MANKKSHDALPPLFKKIIRVTCDYQTMYSMVEGEATQYGTLQRMKDRGVTLHIHPSHNVPGDTTAQERLDVALAEYKRRVAGL